MDGMWKHLPEVVHELHGLSTPVSIGVLIVISLAIVCITIIFVAALK